MHAAIVGLSGTIAVIGVVALLLHFLGFSNRLQLRPDSSLGFLQAEFTGRSVADMEISRNGRSAIALLSDGDVAVLKVVGMDVMVRSARRAEIRRLGLGSSEFSVQFADIGAGSARLSLETPERAEYWRAAVRQSLLGRG